MTAFLRFRFQRPQEGRNTVILTYGESYEDPHTLIPYSRRKGQRCDLSKSLLGPQDTYIAKTVSDLAVFADRVSTAASVNRSFLLGETNLHPYDVEMDETFSAALATLDKSLHAVTLGIQRLYFHQGTINQALFNWWSDNQINAPFYGGYFATLALVGGDHIVELDSGNNSHAQYVIYSKGRPAKAVLVNTDYYSGNGVPANSTITLNGLLGTHVKAVRMTAASSEVTANGTSSYPTIGGQYFSNVDCSSIGALTYGKTAVSSGKVTLTVAASEALLL